MELNYEKDLSIDPSELDEEVMLQPVLYMRYAEELAQAQKERDKVKEKLEVTKADVYLSIINLSQEAGGKKPTVGEIESMITTNDIIKHVADEFNKANYEVSILQAAVRAFDHRKKALEGMIQLHVSAYYAGPKEPRNLPAGKRIIDRASDKASSRQRRNLNK